MEGNAYYCYISIFLWRRIVRGMHRLSQFLRGGNLNGAVRPGFRHNVFVVSQNRGRTEWQIGIAAYCPLCNLGMNLKFRDILSRSLNSMKSTRRSRFTTIRRGSSRFYKHILRILFGNLEPPNRQVYALITLFPTAPTFECIIGGKEALLFSPLFRNHSETIIDFNAFIKRLKFYKWECPSTPCSILFYNSYPTESLSH